MTIHSYTGRGKLSVRSVIQVTFTAEWLVLVTRLPFLISTAESRFPPLIMASTVEHFNSILSLVFSALQVMDYCYRQDDDRAQQLLTYELRNWSKQTCLSLAVADNHRALLSHTCCQILLADLWLGGLRTRKNTNIKVKGISWIFL